MINSSLHQEATGIDLARRQEIVDDTHKLYIDTFPETGLEEYGFSSTASFDDACMDFDARLLPEAYPDVDTRDQLYQSFLNISDRLTFLRGVASSIVLSEVEVSLCAEMLGVREAVLLPATKPKATPLPTLPRFLVAVEAQIAS